MRKIKIDWQILPLLLILILAVAGCGSQAATSAPAAEGVSSKTLSLPVEVDVSTVQNVRDRDDVILIDVREDHEYTGGHIPGTVWLPLGELSNRLGEIPRDKTVVTVCRSGNRSAQAVNFLLQQGFKDVHTMQGGMIAWDQAGYEIER